MKMYELIKRLEHIRDKMESTFSNEFQRGEIDNLIEELIQMSPEVGKMDSVPNNQPYYPNPTWVPSTPYSPFVYTPGITTTGTTTDLKITLDGSSSSVGTYYNCSGDNVTWKNEAFPLVVS
jgi:hypothetical protein